MIEFNKVLHTNGNGYWSNVKAAVRVTGIDLAYNDNNEFGELRVYFNTRTWNVNTDGLIYTDKQFKEELCTALAKKGFNTSDLSYSEQGMQGDNYVSCDVGPNFINSYLNA